jgi:hypothetical protein
MISLGLGLWSTTILSRLGFSPSALFANGEVGVWYDPSPETTFTDTAGTTPATVGSAVALMLDKSKGLVLGPELVTNGDFEDGATGWTIGAGWSVTGGKLSANATTGQSVFQPIVEFAKRYTFSFTVESISGTLLVGPGTSRVSVTQPGQYQFTISNAINDGIVSRFNLTAGGALVATIDNISVRELPGFHAVQSTAAARPILARVPASGRRNLLTRTEEFDNAAWVKAAGVTVTGNADGVADRVVGTASTAVMYQAISVTPGTTRTFSFEAKNNGGTIARLRVRDATNALDIIPINTDYFEEINESNYTRVQVDYVVPAGCLTVWVYPVAVTSAGTGVDLFLRNAQDELGSTATDYQKVTSTYDVTEAGQADNYHLVFDGVDDSMVTPSIDFTGTDEMSVFAGVRKLSNTIGILSEFGVRPVAGSWTIHANIVTGASSYDFTSQGTTSRSATASVADAPITNVVTGLGDISGDLATLRINGAQAAQSTADQGTGNYGNYPLYIGRRGGTSLPFNGHLYQLLVRGALTEGNLLNQTETYVASKTAGVDLT